MLLRVVLVVVASLSLYHAVNERMQYLRDGRINVRHERTPPLEE
jgi:hypothetical protein